MHIAVQHTDVQGTENQLIRESAVRCQHIKRKGPISRETVYYYYFQGFL